MDFPYTIKRPTSDFASGGMDEASSSKRFRTMESANEDTNCVVRLNEQSCFDLESVNTRYRFRRSFASTGDRAICTSSGSRAGCFSDILKYNRNSRQIQKTSTIPVNELPDNVLLGAFSMLHPLDLVHSISYVNKRWNNLAKTASLYKQVRISVSNDHKQFNVAKAFLENISRNVCMLSIRGVQPFIHIPEEVSTSFFPVCMSSLRVLEIDNSIEISSQLVVALAESCPCVEVLRISRRSYEYGVVAKQNTPYELLLKDDSFPDLKHLSIEEFDPRSGKSELLLSHFRPWNRPLRSLCFVYGDANSIFKKLSGSVLSATLTELSICMFQKDAGYANAICQLKNLKKLEVLLGQDCVWSGFLQYLKTLPGIEHLHLKFANIKSYILRELFQLPSKYASRFFPYKLKYLQLEAGSHFDEELAQTIANSCPQLQSLGLAYTEIYQSSLLIISSNFRSLRFLDIGHPTYDKNGCMLNASQFGVFANPETLPMLRFINLPTKPKVTLQKPTMEDILCLIEQQRKNLFVFCKPYGFGNWRDSAIYNNSNEKKIFGEFFLKWNNVIRRLEDEQGFCCMQI